MIIGKKIGLINCWDKSFFTIIGISWISVSHKETKEEATLFQIILLGLGIEIII